MVTSGRGSASDPPDAWPDETTVRDDQRHRLDTPRQDLTALARATAPAAAEDVMRMAFDEGIEEAVRAFYVVMRHKGLTRLEMDNIVLLWRREITGL
jgi:hypothetical protein